MTADADGPLADPGRDNFASEVGDNFAELHSCIAIDQMLYTTHRIEPWPD